jgi:hypothetical protein
VRREGESVNVDDSPSRSQRKSEARRRREMPKSAIITLNEKEFEVKALRVKEIKVLAQTVIRTVKDFYDFRSMNDEGAAIKAMDSILERPEQFIQLLAPTVPMEDIENAYFEEMADAVKALIGIQGFDRLRELSAPLMTLMSLSLGELPETMEPTVEPMTESTADGTTSTPS